MKINLTKKISHYLNLEEKLERLREEFQEKERALMNKMLEISNEFSVAELDALDEYRAVDVDKAAFYAEFEKARNQ